MRRKLVLLMVICLVAIGSVTACGKSSNSKDKEVAESVNALISEDADIKTIIDSYSGLTAAQKKYVSEGADIEKAMVVNKMIDDMSEKRIPSQTEYDAVAEKYNSLTDVQKKYVTSPEIIEKYADINLKEVGRLAERIEEINESTPFSQVVSISEEISKLTNSEQKLLNRAKIDSIMELTDEEKATVAAIETIKKLLKDPSSFQLVDATVVNDLDGTAGYYLVYINYSAKNGFGGNNSDYSFQTIDRKFSNPWMGLAVLSGNYASALKCDSFYEPYRKGDRIKCDNDKIMYYVE